MDIMQGLTFWTKALRKKKKGTSNEGPLLEVVEIMNLHTPL